ncbi:MAG: cupin domain-containing protein, partial [Anaerolineae bacterium]
MFVTLSEVEAVEMVPGVFRRTLTYGQKAMLIHVTLEPGATVPLHSHPHEQLGFVLEGELTMTIGGESRVLKAGDSYLIHPDVEHEARVTRQT